MKKCLLTFLAFLSIYLAGFGTASATTTGAFFDYSLAGTVLTVDLHEPYNDGCENVNATGAYLVIYDSAGNFLSGPASQCTYDGIVNDTKYGEPPFDGGITDYNVVAYMFDASVSFPFCFATSDKAQAISDCAGIMTIVQDTEGPAMPSGITFSVISTTSALDMIAGVGNGVKDTGATLWVIVAIVLGISISFYLFDNVIGILTPEEKRGKVK